MRRHDNPPKPVDEPEGYGVLPGRPDPVPLHYVGARCPGCRRAIAMGSVFLNHENEIIEFWRCRACASYGFHPYDAGERTPA